MRIAPVTLYALILVGPLSPLTAAEGDWPSWRGPDGNGVATGSPPTSWSESSNIEWKTAIPGLGTSTPIVWKNRIYLTTAVDTGKAGPNPPPQPDASQTRGRRGRGGQPANIFRFSVMALDLETGKVVWDKTLREAQPHEGTHPDGTHASNSPVTDGERLFAFFGSNGVYALDLEGNVLWERDLGDMRTRLGFGEGASPALWGDSLVVQWDHEGDSFIVTLDAKTGDERWRKARAEGTSWTTPRIIEVNGRPQVITVATAKVRSYDLETGDLVWEASGMTLNTIPSPVYDDGTVYLMSGFRGNAAMAVDLSSAKGDITETDSVLWTLDRDTPYVPSPLLYDGLIYMLKSNDGILTVVDAKTGKVVYGPERLGDPANVYASPIGFDGKVLFLGRDGAAAVIKAGPQYEVLATNELEDRFDASPVIVGDRLLLRGRSNIYSVKAGS